MCSSFPVRGGFAQFEDFERVWHKRFKRANPKWEESGMYTNSQFDDIPYEIWDKNELIDEFDYHDELIEYDDERIK